MRREIRLYYDVVCPFAYLANERIGAIADRAGADLVRVPVLLGGLFRLVGGPDRPMDAMSGPRAWLNLADILRQGERFGLPLRIHPRHPRRSVEAMRLVVSAPEPLRWPVARELYRAYWHEGRDLADRGLLAEIAVRFGLDVGRIDDPSVKAELFATTEEARSVGAFGVPTFVVHQEGQADQLFWGVDRLHLVEQALGLSHRPAGQPYGSLDGEALPGRRGSAIRFFHDFSSPYSYLASTRIDAVAADAGSAVEWSPFLLGALFRDIGTVDVPLLAMSPARQAYFRRDMQDWAAWWGVPFRFPSHFPLRTVTALRVALVEPAVVPALYRASWAEDRNIGDDSVLAEVLREEGHDAARLLTAASSPDIKARLRQNTDDARRIGACGAPTFWIDGSVLVWGQDRLDQVDAALRGWRPRSPDSGAHA